jgi:predicted outer membrane repeat protein
MRRNLLLLVTTVALFALPGLARAEEPPTTTVAPATTEPPTTQPAPNTTVAPADEPAGETVLAVGDEAEYRAALTALSADVTGSHTIDLTADITIDDGTDPTYTGTQPLTIDGHGFTLDAQGANRLLVMSSAAHAPLTIAALTMANGMGVDDGGAVQVFDASPVTVTDSTFDGNVAQGSGGALAVPADLTVERSTFAGNVSTNGGGGAIVETGMGAVIDITDSLISNNDALGGRGGGIAHLAPQAQFVGGVDVRRTTLVGNRAQQGGAIYSTPGASFVNSTFTQNEASVDGGAVYVDGSADFGGFYGTIAGNRAPDGANLATQSGAGTMTVVGTVIAEPGGGGENCDQESQVNGQASHTDDGSCGFGNDGPALLGPLQDNGGPTPTRAPLPGSPLIDAIRADAFTGLAGLGEDCAPTDLVGDVDQRGEPRPVEGDGEQAYDTTIVPNSPPLPPGCDSGAVEVQGELAPTTPPPTGPVAASPGFTG